MNKHKYKVGQRVRRQSCFQPKPVDGTIIKLIDNTHLSTDDFPLMYWFRGDGWKDEESPSAVHEIDLKPIKPKPATEEIR